MSEEAAEYRPPTPMVIWLIVGAIGVAHLAMQFASFDVQNAMAEAFAIIPERFHADSPHHFVHWYDAIWPFFGHVWLHTGWFHAGVNAFFLFVLGRRPAMLLGPWRFLAVFFISAVFGAVVFLALNWNDSTAAVGASGAVCGIFSAYYLSVRPTWREAIADPLVRNQFGMIFLLNVVLMGVASELFSVPIGWEAHLGGFIGGALGWIALGPKREAWR